MMGIRRYLDTPDGCVALPGHEGDVARLRQDGTAVPDDAERFVIESATKYFGARCSCGWEGARVERAAGQCAWQALDDLPALAADWARHTARPLAELAGHPTTADYEPHPDGSRGWRPRCLGPACTWAGDIHPTEDGARGGERSHHDAVVDGRVTEWRR